jgi:gas vesicle protein
LFKVWVPGCKFVCAGTHTTIDEISGENLMKYAVSLLLGAMLGALIALLFAPSSGEELRSNIKTQADVQAARAREEWQKGRQGLQERINKMTTENNQEPAQPKKVEAAA